MRGPLATILFTGMISTPSSKAQESFDMLPSQLYHRPHPIEAAVLRVSELGPTLSLLVLSLGGGACLGHRRDASERASLHTPKSTACVPRTGLPDRAGIRVWV